MSFFRFSFVKTLLLESILESFLCSKISALFFREALIKSWVQLLSEDAVLVSTSARGDKEEPSPKVDSEIDLIVSDVVCVLRVEIVEVVAWLGGRLVVEKRVDAWTLSDV